MANPRLRHEAHPNHVAAWNLKTGAWTIKYAEDLMRLETYRPVMKLPVVDNRDGHIEASFTVLDPDLGEAEAATLAAHALLDFFWPDAEEEGDVERIVMTSEASGVRYEFEGPGDSR